MHGLGVALGSEIFKFSEAERDLVARRGRRARSPGRVPVVINTGAPGTDLAVQYSRAAEAAGADALMVIPPHFMPASAEEIADYYRTIDRGGRHSDHPAGHPAGAGAAGAGAAARRGVRATSATSRSRRCRSPARWPRWPPRRASVLTVFGGAGGSYFIEEMRRGAQGTMPFCSQPAAFVETWNRFRAGDEPGARQVFDATIMAVNRLGAQGGDLFYHLHKQLLVRLGVIRTAHVRSPTIPVDPVSQREIDELIEPAGAGLAAAAVDPFRAQAARADRTCGCRSSASAERRSAISSRS